MAKVTFGPIVSEARNKVGGVVFSRNPHGAFSRAWAIPPYTNTAAQIAARAAFSTLSERWRVTLTDDQRAGWRALGVRYKHTDVFAQKSNRPGLQAFLRANLALSSVAAATLDDAPRTQRASDPMSITATAASGSPPSIQVDCLVDPQPSEAVQLWVSPQLNPGRAYFFRKMRLIHTEPAGTAAPWDPSADFQTRYGALSEPSKLGIGVRYIDTATGAIGPWRTALITVTAGTGDAMKQSTVQLTQADIQALPSTPFELVPAPAAGIARLPLHFIITQRCNGVAYTNVDPAGYAEILVGGYNVAPFIPNDAPLGALELDNLTGGGSSTYTIPQALNMSNIARCTAWDGPWNAKPGIGVFDAQPTVLHIENNGAGDLTAGDPFDIWQVDTFYVEIAV